MKDTEAFNTGLLTAQCAYNGTKSKVNLCSIGTRIQYLSRLICEACSERNLLRGSLMGELSMSVADLTVTVLRNTWIECSERSTQTKVVINIAGDSALSNLCSRGSGTRIDLIASRCTPVRRSRTMAALLLIHNTGKIQCYGSQVTTMKNGKRREFA